MGEFILNSLSDAEGTEDGTEQVVRGELAGDFVECTLRRAKFFGGELAGLLDSQGIGRIIEMGACAFQSRDVTRTCAERTIA